MKYGVFISYSHADAELIEPVVSIIRTMRNDHVFQDKNDIKPGQPWEIQLTDALEEAKMVVVFWCSHSATSEYVRKEYLRAIEMRKKVLPVILDSSIMDKSLSVYQWIDLKDVITHGYSKTELQAFMAWRRDKQLNEEKIADSGAKASPPVGIPKKPKRKIIIPALVASIILVAFSVSLLTVTNSLDSASQSKTEVKEMKHFPKGDIQTFPDQKYKDLHPSATSHTYSWKEATIIIVGIFFLFLLIVFGLFAWRRKKLTERDFSDSKRVKTESIAIGNDVIAGKDRSTRAAQMIIDKIKEQIEHSKSESS